MWSIFFQNLLVKFNMLQSMNGDKSLWLNKAFSFKPASFILVSSIGFTFFRKLQMGSTFHFWRTVALSLCSFDGGVINISHCERNLQLLRSYPGFLCAIPNFCLLCFCRKLCQLTFPEIENNALKCPRFIHSLTHLAFQTL